QALAFVPDGATVLDIGAGDLRLARRLAPRARMVYAVEQRPRWPLGDPLPQNLIAIQGDARAFPVPSEVDT
ncbi:MAG: rRNA adenine methyltransferase, partial [Anaerolineae bacterium]|nr:rRNA adenine methyltransferase [Anaerolineae bacterium]